jgi:hypothetical protein
MKLNFNFPVLDVKKQPVSDEKGKAVNIAMILANTMINPSVKVGDSLKKQVLAWKIAEEKEIEIDDADFTLIREIINLKDVFAPSVQAQLLLYIDSIK